MIGRTAFSHYGNGIYRTSFNKKEKHLLCSGRARITSSPLTMCQRAERYHTGSSRSITIPQPAINIRQHRYSGKEMRACLYIQLMLSSRDVLGLPKGHTQVRRLENIRDDSSPRPNGSKSIESGSPHNPAETNQQDGQMPSLSFGWRSTTFITGKSLGKLADMVYDRQSNSPLILTERPESSHHEVEEPQ